MTTIPTVNSIPWQESFTIGQGIVVPSGQPTASALEKFTVIDSTITNEYTEFQVISSDSDFQRSLDVASSGEFNIFGTKTKFDAAFASSVAYSRRTLTFVASATIEWQPSLFESLPKLLAEADNLAPDVFRERFGDYFIAGYVKTARFHAIYRLEAESEEHAMSVKAALQVEKPDVFKAKGRTKFMQTCSSHKLNVRCVVLCSGVKRGTDTPKLTQPDDVGAAYEDFTSRVVGIPTKALLDHYHIVKPTLPAQVDIDYELLTSASLTYERLAEAWSALGDIPSAYQRDLTNRLEEIRKAAQIKLGSDLSEQILTPIAKALAAWTAERDEIAAHETLYRKVKSGPAVNSGDNGNGCVFWQAGLTTAQDRYVVIDLVSRQSHSIDYKIGWREWAPRWNDNDYRIVGYEVFADRGDDGHWSKTSGGLLDNKISFNFCSCYDRGMGWTVKIYAVKAAKLRFD